MNILRYSKNSAFIDERKQNLRHKKIKRKRY